MREPRLLVCAAVSDGEAAVAAWRAWAGAHGLATLEPDERRLLPLVYRNLRASGVAEAEIPPIVKHLYLAASIRNRRLFREAAATIDLLASEGIPTLLLKGAALVAGYYRDSGVRPMADFDLLVRPTQAGIAASILERAGWSIDTPLTPRIFALLHAVSFRRRDLHCDLHWHAFAESSDPALADRYFERGGAGVLDTRPVPIPGPEHQLLHVIVHGTRVFDATTTRWIVDALVLLRGGGRDLEWPYLISEAQVQQLHYPVGEACAYLSDEFGAPIPASVIAALRARRVSRLRRWAYRPCPVPRPVPLFAEHLFAAHLAVRRSTGVVSAARWFLRYQQNTWRVPTLAGLPREASRRALRKLAAKVTARSRVDGRA